MRAPAVLIVAASLLAGCAGGHGTAAPPHVAYELPKPPAASTWPPYPAFDSHSCWQRPLQPGTGAIGYAPSRTFRATQVSPMAVAERILARLGDHRYISRVDLAAVPRHMLLHLKGYFGGRRPPVDGRWAWIATRGPKKGSGGMLPEWESYLVGGALDDELCAAGGSPLVGWTAPGRNAQGISDGVYRLGQRFPNPTPAAFRQALRAAADAYGFWPVEVRLLRPLGLAPLVVVRTDRARKDFVKDLPAIEALLDPRSRNAATFEGMYFEARDSKGPFVGTEGVLRGTAMGGQWAWDPCQLPYPHSMPLGSRCP